MKEVWRYPPHLIGICKVSNLGRVKTRSHTIIRRNGSKYRVKGRILSPYGEGTVYIKFHSHRNQAVTCILGRLVLETFIGPCPSGMECCHYDGNPQNNKLDNLRWDTHKNNEKDKIRHGTDQTKTNLRGEDHNKAKNTVDEIRQIRKMRETGKYTLRELAEIFNLTIEGVRGIALRRTWKHIA